MKAKNFLQESGSMDLYKLCLLKKYPKFNNLIWIRMMTEKQVFQKTINPKNNKIRKNFLFPIKKLTSSIRFQLESHNLYCQKNKWWKVWLIKPKKKFWETKNLILLRFQIKQKKPNNHPTAHHHQKSKGQ
jgi:hypothetical protein